MKELLYNELTGIGRMLWRKRLCCLWLLSVLCFFPLCAQVTMSDLPYLCDFEDEKENAQWTLNPGGAKTVNEWVVGKCEAYAGEHSLYISNDGGVHNKYANTDNIVYAYRTMNLAQGRYDFAFDWKGVGNGKDGYLKVLLSSRTAALIKCVANSTEPTWFGSNAINCISETDPSAYLANSLQWSHFSGSFDIPASLANQDISLLLAWVNTNTPVDTTSIMIDNLRLAKASKTGYPENLYVSCDSVRSDVIWTAGADSYLVRYRSKDSVNWNQITVTEPRLTLTDAPWGAYEFWISCFNGVDESVPAVFPTVYLYPTACFDVLNMYNASFETGTWSVDRGAKVLGTEKVDDGYKSKFSRHTTHFLQDEYDVRTNGKLRTVPNGEYGSVRLGNWKNGGEWESISFKYDVASDDASVLLLKYAMVLESPNHNDNENPRFTLSVTEEDGTVIDTKCAQVDFHSPTNTEWKDPEINKLWHRETWRDENNSSHDVVWQDWSVMGIDVAEHKGKQLIVSLATYDCAFSFHFGYAYFMLNCTNRNVEGIPWGEYGSTHQFVAPEGFEYTWIKKNEPDVVISKENVFDVLEADTNTYVCYVSYVNKPDCGWSFEASAKPHNPIAEILCEWAPKDCQNRLLLVNKSHIGLTNQITGDVEHRYDMHPEQFRWTLPDGTITDEQLYDSTYIDIPNEEGEYTFRLWTAVEANDSVFMDSTEVSIKVPAIGPVEYVQTDTICFGEEREFPIGSGKIHSVSGVYPDSLISKVTGCDSVINLYLHVLDPIKTMVYDTICYNGSYRFGNKELTRGDIYEYVFPSVTGCDSLVQLHLTKLPALSLDVENADGCADNIVFVCSAPSYVDTILLLLSDTMVIPVGRKETSIVLPQTDFRAGHYVYEVRFLTPWCTEEDVVDFSVNLPASVVEAKWDNVLAILNENYNGGYRFSSFQWYADGVLLPGATQSYYHAPEIDWDVEYSVEAVLEDGTPVSICPFTFEGRKRSDAAEIRKVIEDGHLYIVIDDKKYNVLGERLF